MIKIAVVTVSDRAASGEREDLSGPRAVALLSELGEVIDTSVVADGTESVREAIIAMARRGADLVFTTGGTGITTRDLTPEATLPLVEKRLYGLEARIRDDAPTPYAALSRGIVGIGSVDNEPILIVNAPGSQGGVSDAVQTLGPLLSHVIDQMRDGDHGTPVPASSTPDSHEETTWKVQNRGFNDGSDADVVVAKVSSEPIDMEQLIEAVNDSSAGAITSFCGQVRNHDAERSVVSIDYQAHPDASEVVYRVAKDVAASSGACKIAVVHREGHLEIGDIALGAAVSASHRAEAFRLLEEVIERVKMELPVWKKQQFSDGTSEWTGTA